MVVQHYLFLSISLYLSGITATSDLAAAAVSELQSPGLQSGRDMLNHPYQMDHRRVAEIEEKLVEPESNRSHAEGSNSGSISYLPESNSTIIQLDTNRLALSEHLLIELVESGMFHLQIRWRLENTTGLLRDVQPTFSRVSCYLGNATVLEKVNSTSPQLRVENLQSNTRYTICVEAVPDQPPGTLLGTRNNDIGVDSVVYARCVSLSTIPLMRVDSIVALALTVGYFLLLTLVGYVTWLLRMRRQAANRKSREQAGLELNNCKHEAGEISSIEERSHLASNFSRKPVSM